MTAKKKKKVVETFEIIAAVIKRKTYKLKLQQQNQIKLRE